MWTQTNICQTCLPAGPASTRCMVAGFVVSAPFFLSYHATFLSDFRSLSPSDSNKTLKSLRTMPKFSPFSSAYLPQSLVSLVEWITHQLTPDLYPYRSCHMCLSKLNKVRRGPISLQEWVQTVLFNELDLCHWGFADLISALAPKPAGSRSRAFSRNGSLVRHGTVQLVRLFTAVFASA